MHLHELFIIFIIHLQSSISPKAEICNDTSANLTITALANVTTIVDKDFEIWASVNYPEKNVEVTFETGYLPPFSDFMVYKGSCLYRGTVFGTNIESYSLYFGITVVAKSPIRCQTSKDLVFATVQVPTTILKDNLPKTEILENETYSLNCTANGNPPSNLKWNLTNHGDNVNQLENYQTIPYYRGNVSSTTMLTIGSTYGAQYSDGGIYQCFGNNSVGEDSISVQIVIHIPVKFWNSSGSGLIEIEEGSSVNISCEFRGFPNPQISWLDTSYISTIHIIDDIYSISTLNLTSAKCEDEKEFICFANNTIVDGNVNASGRVMVTFEDPPPVHNLTVYSDQCNGTFIMISWNQINTWKTDLTYEIKYKSSEDDNVISTKDTIIIINTQPDTFYQVDVTTVSGCNKSSKTSSIDVKTGKSLPSEPRNVTSLQNATTICTIKWMEPEITYDNISQYIISYKACYRGYDCSGNDISNVTLENSLSCEINMTEVNSQYYFEVSAENCAGVGPKSVQFGNCSTDTAAPSNIIGLTLSNFETNGFGTVEVPVTGFKVTIPDQSQQGGEISCYYIVMVRYSELYNTPEQVQDRITINPNNLTAIANASVQDVHDGQPYFAVASQNPETVFIGDDTRSSCSGLTRSYSNENFPAWNRNLTENRSYDMFVLTTVPSVKDETKMYMQSSTANFFNILHVPESSTTQKPTEQPPTEQTTAKPESPNDVPVAAIVIPFVAVILILVGVSIWYYKTKYKQRRKDNRYSENSTTHETLPMSATPEEYFDPLSDAILPSTSHGISRIKSKIATAPPKPIMQPSYENIGLSFEPDAVSSPTFVPFGNLHQKYIERRKSNDRLFSEEFKAIPTEIVDSSITSDVANLLENTKKNRYKNIKTYDKSRVVLSLLPNDPNSDYINASYIHGFSAKNKFIATQGPKSNTVKDFWRMVFEQRCLSIVMLTNIIEKGKNKCVQYWPDVVSGTKDFDCYSVDFLDEIISVDYVTRRFTLRDNANPDKYYTVTQYHFTTWPDHGVPNTTTGMLRFYHRVMKENPTDSGPILVHCSAGVGRTGTFIGIDILTEQMNVLSGADFVKCIYDMRSQRPQMVQSMDQYMFLYKIIVDLHLYGDTEIALPKLHSEIERLERADPKNPRKNGFDVQYERINKVKTEIGETKAAEQSVNKRCNRNPRIIPYDHNRVFLMDPKLGEAVYINASVVKGYKRKDAFVTTQAPLNNTAENFWQMISDYCVSTIVTLNTFAEASMDPLFAYWPESDSSLDFGKFVVTSEGQEEFHGSFCKRNLQVLAKYRKHGNRNVVQYHYLAWEPRRAPKDRTALLEMIAQISRHQQGNGNPPIVVQCSDGSGRSGTFCAIMTLIQCVQIENIVDVFQTVRQLREERIGMVDSMEQYRFCYEIIEDYIKSFDVYSNFNFVESKEV